MLVRRGVQGGRRGRESTFLDLVNKQHDGFIGHAYLGSWVNLGAMTTCSDLKNNYGRIRVDVGAGEEDTGLRFLGLMMAEHGKTAIGTLFNTGTAVGFASNVFAVGFPPKSLPNFTWGDGRSATRQDPARAAATAAVAMGGGAAASPRVTTCSSAASAVTTPETGQNARGPAARRGDLPAGRGGNAPARGRRRFGRVSE